MLKVPFDFRISVNPYRSLIFLGKIGGQLESQKYNGKRGRFLVIEHGYIGK